ncbi:Fc.00g082850.m01.CDS01 [Cosmosporella sp. VM-42]
MKIQLQKGEQLAYDALVCLGYSMDKALIISRHLIDSQVRGYPAAGFARILSIRDRLNGKLPSQRIEVTNETPVTAQLDGNDTLGYLVAQEATEKAIEKAKQLGIAIVSANNTWYTGMLVYYAEMAAKEDLVTIIASNSTAYVAAQGGYKPVNGTNPFCVGFPSSGTPVLWDIGTSKILHADVLLAKRLGTELPPDSAFNSEGEPTTDPFKVLDGSIAPWGGHKGTGLATVVQLFGVLAGSPAFPPNLEQFGYTVIAIDPSKFRPLEDYKKEVDTYCQTVRGSPPVAGGPPLRLPFERSSKLRQEVLETGEMEIDETVHRLLTELIGKAAEQ